MTKKDFDLNLDNIEFIIKKFRNRKNKKKSYGYIKPLFHHKYRLQTTDACTLLYEYAGIDGVAVMWNHELLHAIISELVGIKHGMKEYDEWLIHRGLYDLDICMELWL